MPALLRITPAKLLLALPLPTVSVGVPPDTVSTVPAPVKPLIVSLKPFRSSVPVTLRLPLPTPSGITPAAPSLSVPAATVVSPP